MFNDTAWGTTGRTVLTIDDLTWLGQANVPDTGSSTAGGPGQFSYSYAGISIRYVGGSALANRRLLIPLYHNTSETYYDSCGDLVEMSFPTLTTDALVYDAAPKMVETRRWADWIITDQWDEDFSTGVHLTSTYWDETNGVVWYTMQLYYGTSQNFRFLGATQLLDTAAGGGYYDVGTKYGLWYYRTNYTDHPTDAYHKSVQGWIVPIPAAAQAALGKTMCLGTYGSAPAGNGQQFGPCLHAFTALPSLADQAGSIIPLGTRLMDFSTEYASATGVDPDFCQCRRDGTNYTVPGYVEPPDTDSRMQYDASLDTYASYTPIANTTLLGDVGDCLYAAFVYGTPSNIYLRMGTPAVGGTRVWEYYGAGGWTDLSPSFAEGNVNLTATTNGYWAHPADATTVTVNGVNGYFVRIRVTAQFSTPGVASVILIGCGASYIQPMPQPIPVATATGGYWFGPAHDKMNGCAWIETAGKHGVLGFGSQATGASWYGYGYGYCGATWLYDPVMPSNQNGYHSEDADAALYVFNPDHLVEVGLSQRAANNVGMLPHAVHDWHAKWPNIGFIDPADPGEGNTSYDTKVCTARQANSLVWDVTAQHLIWVPGGSMNYASARLPTVQVFSIG